MNNTALKFAPVFSDDKRVDLSIDGGEATLQLSTYTEGLGWCTQKTMQLDPDLLDEVHRVITAARLKIRRDAAVDTDAETSGEAKILPFPLFS
jgi:hypothetical protein